MKKKILILILILLIFMISGCSVEVNVDISDNKIKESNDITIYQNAIYTKDILRTSFRNYIPIYASDLIVDTVPDQPFSDVLYYNKNTTDLGNGYLFNYKYTFDIDEYEEARTVKDGFRSYNISYDRSNNKLTLSTDNEGIIYFNDYPSLDEVIINIKTDYLVEDNNADRKDGNTYTWVFTKDSNKSINMVINMENNSNNVLGIDNGVIIIIVSLVIIAFIVFIFLMIKNNKNNKL